MSTQNHDQFKDPLKNYDGSNYQDSLEEALGEEPCTAIQAQPFTCVSPDTPIIEAMNQLASLDVACLIVAENDKVVGLFGERDVLDKVADRFDTVKNHPVREVMTADPVVVYDVDPTAGALCAMAAGGYRHLPVVNMDEKILGIVSPQRITTFLQKYVKI